MFYRGVGRSYWPYTPGVDAALCKGLKRMGFAGSRVAGKSVFASVCREQAEGYRGDGHDLLQVEPLEGAVVTWDAGGGDLLLGFEAWLNRSRYDRNPDWSKSRVNFIFDLGGDLGVLETYIGLGRQKANIGALVDEFLATRDIREIVVEAEADISTLVGDHDGEVWITGPSRQTMLDPAHEDVSEPSMRF